MYIFHLVIVISDIFCVSILLILSNQINYMTVFLDLLNDKGGLIWTPRNLSNIISELPKNNTHAAPYCTDKPNQYRNGVHTCPDSWAFHPHLRKLINTTPTIKSHYLTLRILDFQGLKLGLWMNSWGHICVDNIPWPHLLRTISKPATLKLPSSP